MAQAINDLPEPMDIVESVDAVYEYNRDRYGDGGPYARTRTIAMMSSFGWEVARTIRVLDWIDANR